MALIDAYNHVIPKPYFEKLAEVAPDPRIVKFFGALTALHDTDAHKRLLDGFDDYRQVISLANPPLEMLGSPDQTPALARIANDGLAARVKESPDRIAGFIASLPMNNPDAAVAEADRAVIELDARGPYGRLCLGTGYNRMHISHLRQVNSLARIFYDCPTTRRITLTRRQKIYINRAYIYNIPRHWFAKRMRITC